MLANLEARGVPLRSIAAAPDPRAHEQRLLAAGWGRAEAVDMDEAYRTLLDPQDRRRRGHTLEGWAAFQSLDFPCAWLSEFE